MIENLNICCVYVGYLFVVTLKLDCVYLDVIKFNPPLPPGLFHFRYYWGYMESKSENQSSSAAATRTPPMTSCRKKKNEDATFLEDVKDHIDEFIHASMDEHKNCFKKTIKKVSIHFNSHACYTFIHIYTFIRILIL